MFRTLAVVTATLIRGKAVCALETTEDLRLETQLRQAQKMAAIGQATSGIAHDFNNILVGVMGYLELAMDWQEKQGDAALGRYLEQAYGASQRARDLIEQLLAL